MKTWFIGFYLLAAVAGVQAQQKLTLVYDKQKKDVIPLYSGDQNFVSLKDIAELIDANIFDNPIKKKSVLYFPQFEVKVTAFNAFVVINETQTLQMPVATQLVDGVIFVPVDFFLPILNAVLPSPVSIPGQTFNLTPVITAAAREDSEAVKLPSSFSLNDIDFDLKANGLLIRIHTDRKFHSSEIEIWRNKNWVYVTVSGGVFAPALSANIHKAETFDLIKKTLAFQHKASAQLSFQLNGDIAGQDITIDESGRYILISLRLPMDHRTLQQISQQQSRWKIDKIVIDAGHGGKDPGAKGKNGTKEKDITLAIALKLGKLIKEKLGIAVAYTREDDTYPTLHGRTQFANNQNAKLFVSIHCNSNKNSKATGFETFFLSPSRNAEALAVAQKENEVIHLEEEQHHYGDFTNEKFILANMMQSVFVRESEELADYIQKGLDKRLDLDNRGVSQAPFYVLMGASMPCVLVETAFISNPTEEKFLKSEAGQSKLAEGILEGIKQFIKAYDAR